VLTCTSQQWEVFVAAVKNGAFDGKPQGSGVFRDCPFVS
jgi:hypothetical protein